MRKVILATVMAGAALTMTSQLTIAQTREVAPQDRSGVVQDPAVNSGRSATETQPSNPARKLENGTASGKGSGPNGGVPGGN